MPTTPPPPTPLSLPPIAVPGQPLLPADTAFAPGPGVHIFNGHLCASLVGRPTLSTPPSSSSSSSNSKTLSVVAHAGEEKNLLPQVGDTVLARVTRINPRQATVAIFAVGSSVAAPCGHEFQGIIRQQDVRATEKDKVKIFSSFRPGDAVRAQVISLGDQSNYYLSTASNSLGVVFARSETGDPLHPVSWRQMACSRTGVVEDRKVAKPI